MAIEIYDISDSVQCDLCGKDYTTSNDEGGLLFGSKGVCPCCAPRLEADAKRYGEESYIHDRAAPGETFLAFILRVRGGNNTATIITGDDFTKIFGE